MKIESCHEDIVAVQASEPKGNKFVGFRHKRRLVHDTRMSGGKQYTRIMNVLPILDEVINLFF